MPDKKKKQKCYIYTRVSTLMQVDGYSLDAQRDKLKREAEHRGMTVIREFSDEGKSGKNTTDRPEFTRMIDRIAGGNPDGVSYVLVFKLSRFGRNAADILGSLQLMLDHSVNLLCVEDGIDSASATSKILLAVLACVSELERENIAVQTAAGRLQKAREGGWNGGPAPLGYRIVRDGNGRNGHLEIDESEAELVRLIFGKYVRGGIGYAGVAKWLNANGHRRTVRAGGKYELFSASAVKEILRNPVYTGRITYGRYTQEKIPGTRNEYHTVRHDEYDTYDGKHEAIIDDGLWEKVQAKMKAADGKPLVHYGPKNVHMLSGIIRCPGCGAPMYGRVSRRKRSDGSSYPDVYYYSCRRTERLTGDACAYKTHIRADELDEEALVIAQIALESMPFKEDVITAFGKPKDLDALSGALEKLQADRKSLEQKKSRLRSKIKSLDASSDRYDAMSADLEGILMEINDDISDLDGRIGDLEDRIRYAENGGISAEKMLQSFRDVMYNIAQWPDEVQRDLMHGFFDSIEILPEPRPNGLRIRHVRFKFRIPLDGGPVDYDHDVYYDGDDGYDDDPPPDGDPPSGGGPKHDRPGDSPSGGDGALPEIDLSDRDVPHAKSCVPNPTKGLEIVWKIEDFCIKG